MKYFLSIIVVCLLSCKKVDIQLLNKVKILGHGGMGITSSYPLNTYESILASLNIGADGIEIDVQMTKDGHLVAYHDAEVIVGNRTGKIYDFNYEELLSSRVAAYPNIHFTIPHIDTLLQYISKYKNKVITLDCKLYAAISIPYLDSLKQQYSKLLVKYGNNFEFNLESNKVEFLNMMLIENFSIFYYADNFDNGLEVVLLNNYSGITISNDVLNKADVMKAHAANIKVAAFNLHTNKENIDAIEKGVDYIQTDKLNSILALRN